MTFSRLVVAALCRIQHVAIGQKYENKYDSNYHQCAASVRLYVKQT